MFDFVLSWLILIPFIGILIISGIPKTEVGAIKLCAFVTSLVAFVYSLSLFILFDNSTSKFQFLEYVEWLPSLNLHLFIGVDGVSVFFILLSSLLTSICILTSWSSVVKYEKEYYTCFLAMGSLLVFVFSALDILLFYIFFESILMPMFFVIGIWGSRTRKIKAAYQFFLYTLIGSVLMLLAIFLIYFEAGTTDLQLLLNISFSDKKTSCAFFSIFCFFCCKSTYGTVSHLVT